MSKQSPKVAIITGGGRGIGRGIVLALAEVGWHVVVNYRGDEDAARATAEAAQKLGADALPLQADISRREDRERLINRTIDHFGRIDLLVNNAGMAPRQRLDILETTEASYDQVMSVNLKGPFFLTQQVANQMIEQIAGQEIEKATIINIGSISAYTSSPNRGEYCISKAGMGMMTALFADRLANEKIQVFEIRPGIIETDMTSGVSEKYDKLIADGLTPIRRWGTPNDVGQAVVALAQDHFPFSTGEILNVDGGFHMRRL